MPFRHVRSLAVAMSLSVLLPIAIAACNGDGPAEVPDASSRPRRDEDAALVEAGVDANPCAAGEAFCGGVCIPVTADDENCGACDVVCTGGKHCAAATCQSSKIEHVVLIVQENHSFDSYFGRYCQAAAGSNPSCTQGRACCEAAPATEPKGAAPLELTDAFNFASDRNHKQECEVQQINGGRMDGFVTGSTGADTCLGVGPKCSDAKNWALADQATVGPYWALADKSALADRYFQPIAGGTASNNMYFATAHVQFVDNEFFPAVIASGCVDPNGLCITNARAKYTGRSTIADLLMAAGKTISVYADGYGLAKASAPTCPAPPADCPYASCILHPVACHACIYDASDVPFQYYDTLADSAIMKDYTEFKTDMAAGKMPNFAFIKPREFRSEHPNVSTVSEGIAFVQGVLAEVAASPFAESTLVLLTWDEGGGFFDHVAPPASIDTDAMGKPVPYGTRVPMLAIGKFARSGSISHVTMEHSSVLRFLEYNFLGPVGQLRGNDAKVNNIGSLLDPQTTGIVIPER